MTWGERGHVQMDEGAVIERNRNKCKERGRERVQREIKIRKREKNIDRQAGRLTEKYAAYEEIEKSHFLNDSVKCQAPFMVSEIKINLYIERE